MVSKAKETKNPTHKKPLDKAYANFSTEVHGAELLENRLKSSVF